MALQAGQRVGDYEVMRVLGMGGLGTIYEVRHLISNRAEAMKALLPDQLGTPEMAERFRREVQLLATLNHPNIAALHNAFYFENQLMMVMELVHGETLKERRARVGIPLPKLLGFAGQVLAALEYAHAAGIVHRDIKPANIMITEQDVVKVLDFGIARSERSPELTGAGMLIGSLNYISPEQVTGGRATPRSDLYSLGVTLYELMTGQLPIQGSTNYEIMTGHLHQTPLAPAALDPSLPAAVSNAIMRSLAKRPEDRFASARDFLGALGNGAIAQPAESVGAMTAALPGGSGQPFSATESLASQRFTRPPIAQGTLQESAQTPSSAIPAMTPTPSQPLHFDPTTAASSLALDEVSKQLGVYIGPIAKVVVKKLSRQCSTLDKLYAEAAKQIPSDEDRRKFLLSRRK